MTIIAKETFSNGIISMFKGETREIYEDDANYYDYLSLMANGKLVTITEPCPVFVHFTNADGKITCDKSLDDIQRASFEQSAIPVRCAVAVTDVEDGEKEEAIYNGVVCAMTEQESDTGSAVVFMTSAWYQIEIDADTKKITYRGGDGFKMYSKNGTDIIENI